MGLLRKNRDQQGRRRPTGGDNRLPRLVYYAAKPSKKATGGAAASRLPATKEQGSGVGVWLQRIPYLLSAVVIAGSLLYCGILGNNVSTLLPKDGGLRDDGVYAAYATQLFNEHPLNHLKLFFNAAGFKADFQEHFPEVNEMSVGVPIVGRKPVIGLGFATPVYVIEADNQSYVLSDSGLVLAETSLVRPDKLADLRHIRDSASQPLQPGKAALPREEVKAINLIIQSFNAEHMPIDSLELPLGANELQVRISGEGYYIRFALAGKVSQQIGAYLAFIHAQGQNDKPTQYVDVRLEDRVFVR